MWSLKCEIIAIIIGATGIVTKGLRKYLDAVPGNIQHIHYKRQLYLEHHTQYGQYCSVNLEE
jgi:hypothetical protein